MNISRFGIGFRFDAIEDGDEREHAFGLVFSALNKEDVRGLRLFAGHFRVDDHDDESIFTVAFTGGGIKQTSGLFNKMNGNPLVSGALAEYRPVVQTNALRRAEELAFFGRFDECGSLVLNETDAAECGCKKTDVPVKNPFEEYGGRKTDPIGAGIRILIAPDKFKGSMDAQTVCTIIKNAARRILPGCKPKTLPIADGGDGTAETLVRAFDGNMRSAAVTAPDGRKITAEYGVITALNDDSAGTTAVIEMAKASGLALLDEQNLDPLTATSRGTGELIACALNEGIRNFLIGIGGSATNDGGMGAAAALGVKFLDADGNVLSGCGGELSAVRKIDMSGLRSDLAEAKITVMCDVDNPLTGKNGATYTYGPQKGADAEKLRILEDGMKNIAALYDATAGRKVSTERGAGAAGGMGAMLAALLGATLTHGASAVLDAVGFDALLDNADIVVTGEGQLDASSADNGKAVGEVVKRCAARQGGERPVFIIAGRLGNGFEHIYELANAGVFSTVVTNECAESENCGAEARLRLSAERMFRCIRAVLPAKARKNSRRSL